MKTVVALALVSLAAVAAVATAHDEAKAAVSRAVAVLHPAKDGKVSGTITFEKTAAGVKVTGSVSGLEAGPHGFHVHEFGDCSAPDFTSAGSHFNPAGHPHGAPGDAKRHAGDLGNLAAGGDGTATVDHTDTVLSLDGAHAVVGRAVIVHAKADDLKTQPTGDAGGRLACGVIGVAKPQ
ncbi:MAG TPA: superoxide dismutase family protein [Vicinamibacteria bacterium]|jgi:Cu-Zn family superoxide dismutase